MSAFGDWMGTVALMALVLDLTGSATAVGAILMPADRHGRQRRQQMAT